LALFSREKNATPCQADLSVASPVAPKSHPNEMSNRIRILVRIIKRIQAWVAVFEVVRP
jgi:hypothetical protein